MDGTFTDDTGGYSRAAILSSDFAWRLAGIRRLGEFAEVDAVLLETQPASRGVAPHPQGFQTPTLLGRYATLISPSAPCTLITGMISARNMYRVIVPSEPSRTGTLSREAKTGNLLVQRHFWTESGCSFRLY